MERGVEYRLLKSEDENFAVETQVQEQQQRQQSEIHHSEDPLRNEDLPPPPPTTAAGDQAPLRQSSQQRGILRRSRRGPVDSEDEQPAARPNRVTIREMETTADETEGLDGRVAAVEVLHLNDSPMKGTDRNKSSTSLLMTETGRRKLPRLQSQLELDELGKNEKELKASLYFHIGSPLKRWKIERIVPVKMILQILKSIFLVIQVSIFTHTIPHQRAEFFYNSREVFENLFFTLNSKPPRGLYTAFSTEDFFQRLDHICESYYQLPNITIGGFDFEHQSNGTIFPVEVVLRQYSNFTLNATSFDYILNGTLRTVCFYINKDQNARDVYKKYAEDPLFNSFFDMTMSFPVNNIRVVHPLRAECFKLKVKIIFVSEHDSGKINYYLRESHDSTQCNQTVLNESNTLTVIIGFLTFLDTLLIALSVLSIFFIFTTFRRAVKLAKAMGAFYHNELQIKLGLWERKSLFPGWHFLNLLSDIFIIIGSAYKIPLNFNVITHANPSRILLGTAVMFQAGSVLRYISYFKELNALNRTLYLAFPEILKFLLCSGMLFLAFSLTGFVVLGPFHPKFETFYETFETLFSLLNGDDIYATFDLLDTDDEIVAYVYSRIFLYVFLVLFIYFVLNLFTSLVISAYEASQNVDNAHKNEVRRFIFSGPLTQGGVALRDITLTSKYVDPQEILKRREKKEMTVKRNRSYSLIEGLATAA